MNANQTATLTVPARDQKGIPTGEMIEYQLYPVTLEDLEQLQPWLDAQFPDPFQAVTRAIKQGDYTVVQQQFLMSKAIERATAPRVRIGTAESEVIMSSLEGMKQLLLLSIRKGKPDVSAEDAHRLFSSLTLGDLQGMALPSVASRPTAAEAPEPARPARQRKPAK